ncbi:MAG: hypothetical protein A2219_04870 [Elusimicrobia bacterium RIFOXYA2_FULL_50_26]|nr:MAG: hypothetical protein A2219_04870 [Elusimicrobia bacterium RIFOXYA2_FULL_50_26]OGS23363.1 MAG: hypothetical protein A2314_08135 [Elusimicrobia bacterium RIFOXYB2_FULL_50_12]
MRNAMEKYKRYRLWIDPALQFKYIGINVIILLCFAVVIGGGIYLGIWRSVTREFSEVRLQEDLNTVTRIRQYEAARTRQPIDAIPFLKEDAKLLSSHQRELLNSIIVRTNRNLLPLIAGMILLVIAASLVLSHRFAGPLYRIKRNLDAVTHGDLTTGFSLRRKDELKDLASEIEHSISGFSATVAKIKKIMPLLKDSASTDERNRYIAEIEQIIAYYKTPVPRD